MIRNGGIHDEPSEKGSDACEGCDAGAGMWRTEAFMTEHELHDQRDQQEHRQRQETPEMRAHTAPLAELPECVEAQRI